MNDEEREVRYRLTITMAEEVITRNSTMPQDEYMIIQGVFIIPGGSADRFWTRSRMLTHILKEPLMENAAWWLSVMKAKGMIESWSLDPFEVEDE